MKTEKVIRLYLFDFPKNERVTSQEFPFLLTLAAKQQI